METVEQYLIDWSKNMPRWQQYLLFNIIKNQELSDDLVKNSYLLLKEEHKLLDKGVSTQSIKTPEVSTIDKSDNSKTTLLKIHNAVNINALVEGESIEFDPQFTVIYGGNGSGKSGYARVLADAGFSRGDKDILRYIGSNKQTKDDSNTTQSIEIEVQINDETKHFLHKIGEPCPELSKFYVFDSTSVIKQLTDPNEFSFSPMGMEYFSILAKAIDEVKSLLGDEIKTRTKPLPFVNNLSENSPETSFVKTLNANTSFKELNEMCNFTDSHRERLDQIPVEIANLSEENIRKEIDNLKSVVKAIEHLKISVNKIEDRLSNEHLQEINDSINRSQTISNNLSIQSSILPENYSEADLEKFHLFGKASIALTEILHGNSYPTLGQPCLLCQRPLDEDSANAIQHLWEIIKTLEDKGIEEAKKNIKNELEILTSLQSPNTSTDFPMLAHYLKQEDSSFLDKINEYSSDANIKLQKIKLAIVNCQQIELFSSKSGIKELLDNLSTKLEEKILDLEAVDPYDKILNLQTIKASLLDRESLHKNTEVLINHLGNLKWIENAERISINTRKVTEKQTQFFDKVVTDKYIAEFNSALNQLDRPLFVEPSTSGKKGKTMKRLAITDEDSGIKHSPYTILSEGEKRMVALIDFLTEVKLDPNSCGIVFDDPATSLDAEWKETIADLIVEQSTKKQVVVFTHDLHFLSLLTDKLKDLPFPPKTHWIKRSGLDKTPGHIFLDNSPVTEKNYRDKKIAEKYYNESLSLGGEKQDEQLKLGFGALRTSYEVLVIFELFNDVVQRFGERISVGRLKEISWDDDVVKNIMANYERISRFIDAHSHSDNATNFTLSPELLKKEIDEFDALRTEVKKLKLLKKQKNKS